MCSSITGRNPASVAFTEYRPAGRMEVVKRPRSFVNNCAGEKLANCSEVTMTVAPSWGVPEGSTTTPVILPEPGAAANGSVQTQTMTNAMPRTRIKRSFKTTYLPCVDLAGAAAGAAAGACADGAFTVKSAVGVMVWFAK